MMQNEGDPILAILMIIIFAFAIITIIRNNR